MAFPDVHAVVHMVHTVIDSYRTRTDVREHRRGKLDYVMANPPFNVDEVVYERVKDDARFNTYDIPKNKSKSTKKASDKKETVPNTNYLWISYFASALKDNGKATLVMANSTSDAENSKYDIRKKMIEEGIISQMVTLPSNMFFSVTLPATLWFFYKAKAHTAKKYEILFVDARNAFTQIDIPTSLAVSSWTM